MVYGDVEDLLAGTTIEFDFPWSTRPLQESLWEPTTLVKDLGNIHKTNSSK